MQKGAGAQKEGKRIEFLHIDLFLGLYGWKPDAARVRNHKECPKAAGFVLQFGMPDFFRGVGGFLYAK